MPALLRRAGDCTVAPIRAIASFLHGWAAVKRSGANRFGYSAGAFRVLCHAFRCRDSIAVPIFPLFSPPGCSINPSKSVVERPIPAAPSARARRPPTLGQFRSVEIQASAAKLAAIPAGASPADIGGPVDVVVISSGGKDDRPAGSLEVKVPGGWGSIPARSVQGGKQPGRP